MALPTVTITCSSFADSTSKRIMCQQVSVAHKREVIAKPNANGTAIVEAQTQAYENPTYTIQGIHFTGASGTFTYRNAIELMKHDFNGSNAPTLTVTYGTGAGSTLVGNTYTSPISVVAKSFTTNLSVTDSRDASLPIGSLTLQETKTD